MPTPPLLQEVSQLHATCCAPLANPRRVRVLDALAHQPRTGARWAADPDLPPAELAGHRSIAVEYALADHCALKALDLLHEVWRAASRRVCHD